MKKAEKKVLSGWHTIGGYDVYVEDDGTVKRGVKSSVTGCGLEPAYVWKPCKSSGGFYRVYSIDFESLKSMIYRGTAFIF